MPGRHTVIIALVTFGIAAAPVGTVAAQPMVAPPTPASCLDELDRLGVSYKRARRRSIDIGVEVIGAIGPVAYRGYKKRPLVLDCSLVVSLARVGRYMGALGVERVTYSSSYQRRKVSGTNRWSKHSYGLAIDIHVFAGEKLGTLRVKDDYEQGLGDD
ncbi:MAG: hypothetical protein GY778_06295, partial [bacterium]|nr:hypothetical protein [bacterium]